MSTLKYRRPGLTLMELIVVLVVLVALAALIIPRISGITGQANSGVTTNSLAGINQAMGRFEAQFGRIPTAWDGILAKGQGGLYSKLHPKLAPLVQAQALTPAQAKSLYEAGLQGVHFQDESWTTNGGMPSDSGQDYVPVMGFDGATPNTGSWCVLVPPPSQANFVGHNIDFPDRAFSINCWKPERYNSVYVVVGLGKEASCVGSVMTEAPIFQAAEPQKYYARALCVFQVPGPTQTYFKARYIGCFAPDGTCIQDNVNSFNANQQSDQ